MLQVYQLHLAFIAQLEGLGLPQWAVYVALHLPDHPQQPYCGLREQLVRELVCRHAAVWAQDAGQRSFLTETLQLPQSLVAEALAQWDKYNGNDAGRDLNTIMASPWS